MPSITFDGPNKLIEVGFDGPFTEVEAADIYSEWKRWVKTGEANWLPAFGSSEGGAPLGGGRFTGAYYFIRNDLGWRLAPFDADHTLDVIGDFYPADPNTEFVLKPTSDVLIRFFLSSNTQAIETGSTSVDYDRIKSDTRKVVTASTFAAD
jgi:hypothetical protein